jgi:hypothetical protein
MVVQKPLELVRLRTLGLQRAKAVSKGARDRSPARRDLISTEAHQRREPVLDRARGCRWPFSPAAKGND